MVIGSEKNKRLVVLIACNSHGFFFYLEVTRHNRSKLFSVLTCVQNIQFFASLFFSCDYPDYSRVIQGVSIVY